MHTDDVGGASGAEAEGDEGDGHGREGDECGAEGSSEGVTGGIVGLGGGNAGGTKPKSGRSMGAGGLSILEEDAPWRAFLVP